MKTLFLILPLLVLAPAQGFSIFSLDADPYTTSTGEWVLKCDARYRGMGYAGLALADSINYNSQNPASYADVDYTLIGITYTPQFTRVTESGSDAFYWNFSDDFPTAELVVSLGRFGTAFGGYKRERLLNYDITYQDNRDFTLHRYGSGGTYAAHAGYAYAYKNRFSAGLSLGALYGKTKTGSFIVDRPESASRLEPSRTQQTTFNDYTVSLGGLYRLGPVSAALSGSLPLGRGRINQEHQIIQNYTGSDSTVSVQVRDWEQDFQPPAFSAGLAYAPVKRLNLVADLHGALWDRPDREFEYHAGVGAEFFFSKRRSDKYFLNVPLRLGYYLHDPGYTDNIREQALTLGFSLPTAGHFGMINVAVEGGKRYEGSLASTNLTETFTRVTVQLLHKGRWGRLRRAKRPAAPAPQPSR